MNAKQQRAISMLPARAPQEQKFQIITPKRLSLLISLAFHLIMGVLATLYIVQVSEIYDDAVVAEFIKLKESPKPKRRVSPRVVERTERPQTSQILPPRLQQPITTAVEIPTGDARFTLPASDIFIPIRSTLSDSGAGIGTEGLERRLLTGGHRAEIPSIVPRIVPQRIDSIIDKIESTKIPQTAPAPEAIEPPTVELKDVTQPPRFLHKVSPKYPELARRAQREGIVLLEATIGVDGLATDIKVIKEIGFGCEHAAIEALKASRFVPARQREQVVIVRIQIPYRFRLED